jgi:hypothetical protein
VYGAGGTSGIMLCSSSCLTRCSPASASFALSGLAWMGRAAVWRRAVGAAGATGGATVVMWRWAGWGAGEAVVELGLELVEEGAA